MIHRGDRVFNLNNFIAIIYLVIAIGFYLIDPDYLFFLILIPFGFFVISLSAFYFEITINELIVKNYMIPFLKIHYKLTEIKQIKILRKGKGPAKARVKIIMEDISSLPIPVSSLGKKDWQHFVNDLSELNIPVLFDPEDLRKRLGITV